MHLPTSMSFIREVFCKQDMLKFKEESKHVRFNHRLFSFFYICFVVNIRPTQSAGLLL